MPLLRAYFDTMKWKRCWGTSDIASYWEILLENILKHWITKYSIVICLFHYWFIFILFCFSVHFLFSASVSFYYQSLCYFISQNFEPFFPLIIGFYKKTTIKLKPFSFVLLYLCPSCAIPDINQFYWEYLYLYVLCKIELSTKLLKSGRSDFYVNADMEIWSRHYQSFSPIFMSYTD